MVGWQGWKQKEQVNPQISGRQFLVRGIVQGVGFRPFVFNLASRLGIAGWVRNSSAGVEIQAEGPRQAIQAFETELRSNPPPLSRIDEFTANPLAISGYTSFIIMESQPQPGEFLPVSPDVSICPDCRRELFDPGDRRYRYPFINCTNCGPRFTIIQNIPYDRPNTTMSGFPLCARCAHEYQDPSDRRFHAQPIACPVCGPSIWLEIGGACQSTGEEALQAARRLIQDGGILAVKGLGGFHLACDASNSGALAELRQRKRRSEKPFALMAFDMEAVEKACLVKPAERLILENRASPVVLLEEKPGSGVAVGIAPGQKTLGVMLAYTPLHLLLLEPAPGFPELLVMTSGNISEEPIAYDDEDARRRLPDLADALLMHNRPIHTRLDDSVQRFAGGAPIYLRRSRGFAPDPLLLAEEVPPALAGGAELKNTFCLTRDRYAFVSHHIGDMENYETLQAFEASLEHYQRLFKIDPELLACDLHPDYLASRVLREKSVRQGLPLVEVQHHHAHLAACLAENRVDSKQEAIGLTFDGTGYGRDGAVWGGEVLYGGYAKFDRLFQLKYLPLPGGDAATRRPARMALAALWAFSLDWDSSLEPVKALCEEERTTLKVQLESRINTPQTSSMGRLFDIAASLAGVRQVVSYEGQAAMEFEALADPDEEGLYSISIDGNLIDPAPVISALLTDWYAGVPAGILSARFHNGLAFLCLQVCQSARSQAGSSTVALSGGVWQNHTLLEKTLSLLHADGFTVLTHRILPPNDGCISLGQVMVAVHQMDPKG